MNVYNFYEVQFKCLFNINWLKTVCLFCVKVMNSDVNNLLTWTRSMVEEVKETGMKIKIHSLTVGISSVVWLSNMHDVGGQ